MTIYLKLDINTCVPDFTASYRPKGLVANGLSVLLSPITVPYNKVRELGQSLLSSLIYPAASESYKQNLDQARLENSRKALRSIGGVNYVIKTPDGELLDTMFCSAEKFREHMVKSGGQFKTKLNSDGQTSSVLKIYSPELRNLLLKMGAEISDFNSFKAARYKAPWEVKIPRPQNGIPAPIPTLDDKPAGIYIIGEGNASYYERNRAFIFEMLLSGTDCISPNIRGTGRSTGRPTENGTYLDYESVYQFLTEKLNYSDDQITGFGYCLSSGPITNLASQHAINLDIDRGYSKIGDIFADVVTDHILTYSESAFKSVRPNASMPAWSSWLIQATLTPLISNFTNLSIIGYDNGSKISQVKGNICVVDATEDVTIPKDSTIKLKAEIGKKVHTSEITFNGDHTDTWDAKTREKHQTFLAQREGLRNFGNTSPPSWNKRYEYYAEYAIDQKSDACVACVLAVSALNG